ncbi:MAG: homocysteine S-methyltransferase family protein [Candidatus Wallbacteria bacterium]|nr:homocysteine S-methyltransferase family protein [Candidatus Wallbacteria bacterium]
MDIIRELKKRILIGDGAMGTVLQKYGLLNGQAPELLNLQRPDEIEGIHLRYLKSGADLIETNTFGANSAKLAGYGLSDRVRELNLAGAKLARAAAGTKAFVAGSVGPTGLMVNSNPAILDEISGIYREQIRALCEGGIDLILFETFSDLSELKAAVVSALEFVKIPVFAQMTFDRDGRTLTGTDPSTFASTMETLGVSGIGINCSVGSGDMIRIIEEISDNTRLFISVFPNAGIPSVREGKTIYPESPATFVENALVFVKKGANLIGGCCGTDESHIRELSLRLKDKLPKSRNSNVCSSVCSISKTYRFGSFGLPPLLIGERLNPTGKKKLALDIGNRVFFRLRQDAVKQEREKAQVLDLNVSVPGTDELTSMKEAVRIVQTTSKCALCVDSPNHQVLSAVLPYLTGRAIVNSINGDQDVLELILPLLKKWGCMAIALLLDKQGIPETAGKRVKIAERILKTAERYGLDQRHFLFDPLALTIGVNRSSAQTALESLRILKNLGVFTSLGVSNVSHGLPGRSGLNAAFLSQAIDCGVSAVIINPGDSEVMKAYWSASALSGRDEGFLNLFRSVEIPMDGVNRGKLHLEKPEERNLEEELAEAVVNGATKTANDLVEFLSREKKPLEILNQILMPAMTRVGKLFEEKEFYLPQLIAAAETMCSCTGFIAKLIAEDGVQQVEKKILLATVEGDIHDIGKNIVSALLRSNGFTVIDLGKDVKKEIILERLQRDQQIRVLGLSALMTTTMVKMKEVIELVKREIPAGSVKIVVGGAVLTPEYASEIGADYCALDALHGVKLIKEIFE